MNLEQNIQNSIELYLNNMGIIFLSGVIASILSLISLGILTGPLFGGLLILSLKILRGDPVDFMEIFAHFNKLLPTLLLCLIAGISLMITKKIPVIGTLLFVLLSPFILVITAIALIIIIEKDYPLIPALREGVDFFKTDPMVIWIYGLITLILSISGAIIFGIGALLTIPFATSYMAVAYQEYSDKGEFGVSVELH